jgi:hypothetical protein
VRAEIYAQGSAATPASRDESQDSEPEEINSYRTNTIYGVPKGSKLKLNGTSYTA